MTLLAPRLGITIAMQSTCLSAGEIKEVAETRCGSEAGLQAAIARGDVLKVTDEKNKTLYYFPRKTYGTRTDFGTKQSMERSKETTGGAYATVQAFINNVGWTVTCTQKQLEASIQ